MRISSPTSRAAVMGRGEAAGGDEDEPAVAAAPMPAELQSKLSPAARTVGRGSARGGRSMIGRAVAAGAASASTASVAAAILRVESWASFGSL